jgi:hypothetical protein
LFTAVRIPLHGAAGVARDDDATAADPDARAHGGQEEREALLAERPFERGRDANVVPHPDPPRQLDVPPSPNHSAVEGLHLREAEQGDHPFPGDPSFHPAVPTLHHRTAHAVYRIKPFSAPNL